MSNKPVVGAIHFGPVHTLEATPATDLALCRNALDRANAHIRLLTKALELATKGGRYTAEDWLLLAEGKRTLEELQGEDDER